MSTEGEKVTECTQTGVPVEAPTEMKVEGSVVDVEVES